MPSMNGNSGGFDFSQWSQTSSNSMMGIINRESNRANYGALLSDKRMEEVRKMLFRMVQRWNINDVSAIIANYGDSDLVKPGMSKEKLWKQAVETIIINMDPSELEALANKTKYRVAGLRNAIKKNDKNADKHGKTALLDMMKQYQDVKNSKNYKDYRKGLKKGPIKPGKILKGNYRKLTQELREYLRTYNIIDLRMLAANLGVEINESEKVTPKILIQQIINLVCLYVDIITGKNKNLHYGNAIDNPDGIKELLKYTSYGYLVGTGMSPAEGRRLREEARRNKMLINMRLNLMKKRSSGNSKDFRKLSGTKGAGAAGYLKLANEIKDNDRGVLRDCDMEELLDIAVNYGVNPRTKNIGKLKLEIYRAMAAEAKTIRRAEKGPRTNDKRLRVSTLKDIQETNTMSRDRSNPEKGIIISALTDVKDGADRTTGKMSQPEHIYLETIDKFESLRMGSSDLKSIRDILSSKRVDGKPLQYDGTIPTVIRYMVDNLGIEYRYLTEAISVKEGNNLSVINGRYAFLSSSNSVTPEGILEEIEEKGTKLFCLRKPYAIYLAYLYLVATKQTQAAEALRSEFGLSRKTYKQLIPLAQRMRRGIKNTIKRGFDRVIAPIKPIISFSKSTFKLITRDKRNYTRRESLNESDLDFLGELESQTVGGLREVCTQKFGVDLGQFAQFSKTLGLTTIQEKEALIYVISRMMRRAAISKYLEYSLLEKAPENLKNYLEAIIKDAQSKKGNKLKAVFSFSKLRDKLRRSGFGNGAGGGKSARRLTRGISDADNVFMSGSSEDEGGSGSDNGGVPNIISILSIGDISINGTSIGDSITNFFSLFNDESTSIFSVFSDESFIGGYQNFFSLFNDESTSIFSVFSDETFISGYHNFFSLFNDESIFSVFKSETFIDGFNRYFNIFSEYNEGDIQLISMGFNNFYTIFSQIDEDKITDIAIGIGNFFNIFSEYSKDEITIINAGVFNFLNIFSTYTIQQSLEISEGFYNFFNIFRDKTFFTGFGNFYKIFNSISIDLAKVGIGIGNYFNMFSNQEFVNSYMSFFNQFNRSENNETTLVSNVASILSILQNVYGDGDQGGGRHHAHDGFVGPTSFEHSFMKELSEFDSHEKSIAAYRESLLAGGLSEEDAGNDLQLNSMLDAQNVRRAELQEAQAMYESTRKNTNFDHGIEATRYLAPDAKALRLNRVRKAIADPVFVVNNPGRKSERNTLKGIQMQIAGIGDYLSQALPLLAASSAGPLTPGAFAAIAGLTATQISSSAANIAGTLSGLIRNPATDAYEDPAYARGSNSIKGGKKKLIGIPAFAKGNTKFTTGAYKQYLNQAQQAISAKSYTAAPNLTSFISGDTLDGSGNPELVNINWDNRSASVKPIPADTEFKAARSGVMSQYERQLPMSVSIKNNLVKYSNITFPSNITDDGSGMAVKTYQINNPITDPINVNGKETSMLELIALIAETLANIQGGVEAGNQIQSVIAANTAKSASGGGSSSMENTGTFTSSFDDILQGM